jgi:hypothetical protein
MQGHNPFCVHEGVELTLFCIVPIPYPPTETASQIKVPRQRDDSTFTRSGCESDPGRVHTSFTSLRVVFFFFFFLHVCGKSPLVNTNVQQGSTWRDQWRKAVC